MIKQKSMSTALALFLSLGAGCEATITSLQNFYDCHPIYDDQGVFHGAEKCGWLRLNDNGQLLMEEDAVEYAGDVEALKTTKLSDFYQRKFSLSPEKANWMAQTVNDFESLIERDEEELARFARNFYGQPAEKIVKALKRAQAGEDDLLKKVITDSAKALGVKENVMRKIVKELHGQVLEMNGIDL